MSDVKEQARKLCYAIEELPASEQQTALSIQASELLDRLSGKQRWTVAKIIILERVVMASSRDEAKNIALGFEVTEADEVVIKATPESLMKLRKKKGSL